MQAADASVGAIAGRGGRSGAAAGCRRSGPAPRREALKAAASRREEARSSAEEASREEVSLGERLAGLESRQAVLRDLLARREGTPAGARELMAAVDGCRLLTEVLTVEPGYERALAAALGPVVQAVVVSGPPDVASALLHSEGPLEAVWESRALAHGAAADVAPRGDSRSVGGGFGSRRR